jgi:hypothetical protein
MFVFDEIDKMPPGLIDTVKPYLDYYDNLNGIDYRKAIFILSINPGGILSISSNTNMDLPHFFTLLSIKSRSLSLKVCIN